MLVLVTARRQIPFSSLEKLYNHADRAYLNDVFFRTPGAALALWEHGGEYVSALRLEPYRDGLLIAGLVTAENQRRQGHARQLIRAVQEIQKPGTKLYSHVSKTNVPSLGLHEACGFRIIRDCARYLDGSVDHRSYTLLYEK